MRNFRIRILLAVIVLICGVSLIGFVYILLNRPTDPITPGIVVTHPSPVATPVQPVTIKDNLFTIMPRYHSTYTPTYSSARQSAPTNTSSFRIHTTSSATVQHVGGGGNGYGIATSTGNSSAGSRGIVYNGAPTMPAANFVALASSRQVAEPAASEAPQMASLAPRRAPGPPTTTDLPDENQLVEQPVGDAVLPLAIIAMLYAVGCFLNRKKQNRLSR